MVIMGVLARTIMAIRFSNLLTQKAQNRAIRYLKEKQRVKGKEIEYQKIEMAEYLSPSNKELTTEEKRKLFALRNNMTLMNYSKTKLNNTCSCGKIETLEHIYYCKRLNKDESEIPFENLYSKNIKNQIKVYRRLEKALENREIITKIVNISPCDLSGSTTFCSIG